MPVPLRSDFDAKMTRAAAKQSKNGSQARRLLAHYCEIDGDTVGELLNADSMGRFYNATIKGNFDCRTHRVPDY